MKKILRFPLFALLILALPSLSGVAVAAEKSPGSPGAAAGKAIFDNNCARCHGVNASTSAKERDVRGLKAKYQGDWEKIAKATIYKGRPNLGMPPWGNVLKMPEIDKVLEYLKTLQ